MAERNTWNKFVCARQIQTIGRRSSEFICRAVAVAGNERRFLRLSYANCDISFFLGWVGLAHNLLGRLIMLT